jgi:hypothetical protein
MSDLERISDLLPIPFVMLFVLGFIGLIQVWAELLHDDDDA